jgi:hypothetical protein
MSIFGPVDLMLQPVDRTVTFPRNGILEFYTLAYGTFDFNHLALSNLFSASIPSNLPESTDGPRCSWLGGATYSIQYFEI